jgi:diguanylate cyclase (GGDEF)-like protein/PAS domain S-box-containing protein
MAQSAHEFEAIDRLKSELRDDAEMFHLAPVSLWLEDFSGVKKLFDAWRSTGVTSLREYLLADPSRIKVCSNLIRVIKVNRATLSLFGARDLNHLVENLETVFRDEMLNHHVTELEQLWGGATEFISHSVNYTVAGRRIDVQLRGSVLPGYEDDWSRVLVSVEDITEREAARRRAAASETYARGLFHHSPVSLWVEDFSSIKVLLDEVRERGIVDFRVFTDVHPEFVRRCMSEIRVLDVNRHTLQMFGAPDVPTLLNRLNEVFRDDMEPHFREQLVDLWDGKLFQLREVVNYTLEGTPLHVHLQFSVLPGHEADWSLVQVALTDITARKKAEAYLEYLGKHDVLTKLYNRSFYVDELNRLERKDPHPVSIVIADLNGLKAINDTLGHAAGDALLRRVGEVLNKAIDKPRTAARIGGDEFAVLLPATDEREAKTLVESIENLIELNNQFYSAAPINLSIGAATSRPGERLEEVAKRADAQMYESKREFYGALRRKGEAA